MFLFLHHLLFFIFVILFLFIYFWKENRYVLCFLIKYLSFIPRYKCVFTVTTYQPITSFRYVINFLYFDGNKISDKLIGFFFINSTISRVEDSESYVE